MSGFYLQTSDGNPIHVNGNPKMSQENKDALLSVFEAAKKQKTNEQIGELFSEIWTEGQDIDRNQAFQWFKAGYLALAKERNKVEEMKEAYYNRHNNSK